MMPGRRQPLIGAAPVRRYAASAADAAGAPQRSASDFLRSDLFDYFTPIFTPPTLYSPTDCAAAGSKRQRVNICASMKRVRCAARKRCWRER